MERDIVLNTAEKTPSRWKITRLDSPLGRDTGHPPLQPPGQIPLLARLAALKAQLALVRTASLLAGSGKTRATAREIAEAVFEEEGLEVTPSVVGQTFADLGLRTVASHGRSRFVLDDPLLGVSQQTLTDQLESLAPLAEQAVSRMAAVAERARSLEARLKESESLPQRERQLRREIQILAETAQQVKTLEQQAARLRQQGSRIPELTAECQRLEEEFASLPDLAGRCQELAARLSQFRAEEEELQQQEEMLKRQLNLFRRRQGLASLAQIEEALAEARLELEDLTDQLGEKRSLISRLWGRNPGGSRS